MSDIVYRQGDLFADLQHIRMDTVVAHVVNDIGLFDAGFAAGVAQHYPEVKQAYLDLYQSCPLGSVQLVEMDAPVNGFTLTFANLFAQYGVRSKDNPRPLSYRALDDTLKALAKESPPQIWMPMIGCGLAGGHWSIVSKIILHRLVSEYVRVVVYSI